MATSIATHERPAWKDRANFLVFADLSADELGGRWEQLWARQLGATEFELCCIPFFASGLALGDRFETVSKGNRSYVADRVTHRSGRQVVRMWLAAAPSLRADAEEYLVRSNLLFEWSSTNLLAIDVPPNDESSIIAWVESFAHGTGVLYEIG
jgi:hypothetical protein